MYIIPSDSEQKSYYTWFYNGTSSLYKSRCALVHKENQYYHCSKHFTYYLGSEEPLSMNGILMRKSKETLMIQWNSKHCPNFQIILVYFFFQGNVVFYGEINPFHYYLSNETSFIEYINILFGNQRRCYIFFTTYV